MNKLCWFSCKNLLLLAWVFTPMVWGSQQESSKSLHTYSVQNLTIEQHEIFSEAFALKVQVKVFLPPNYQADKLAQYATLYINDGQDAVAVNVADTLQQLYTSRKIKPIIVVAISMLPDRMATYGFSDRESQKSLPAETHYGSVGKSAHEYSEWLALKLVPYIDRHYRTLAKPQERAILGWSLGAANAFNIGWNYPDVFSKIGSFSASFWLSEKSNDPSTQLVHKLIVNKPLPESFSVWLAVGTEEETDDRDSDGIIDTMDDSQDLLVALENKKLANPGSTINHDFSFTPFPGGQHNQQTWKRMLPDFLIWAYPLENPSRK